MSCESNDICNNLFAKPYSAAVGRPHGRGTTSTCRVCVLLSPLPLLPTCSNVIAEVAYFVSACIVVGGFGKPNTTKVCAYLLQSRALCCVCVLAPEQSTVLCVRTCSRAEHCVVCAYLLQSRALCCVCVLAPEQSTVLCVRTATVSESNESCEEDCREQ